MDNHGHNQPALPNPSEYGPLSPNVNITPEQYAENLARISAAFHMNELGLRNYAQKQAQLVAEGRRAEQRLNELRQLESQQTMQRPLLTNATQTYRGLPAPSSHTFQGPATISDISNTTQNIPSYQPFSQDASAMSTNGQPQQTPNNWSHTMATDPTLDNVDPDLHYSNVPFITPQYASFSGQPLYQASNPIQQQPQRPRGQSQSQASHHQSAALNQSTIQERSRSGTSQATIAPAQLQRATVPVTSHEPAVQQAFRQQTAQPQQEAVLRAGRTYSPATEPLTSGDALHKFTKLVSQMRGLMDAQTDEMKAAYRGLVEQYGRDTAQRLAQEALNTHRAQMKANAPASTSLPDPRMGYATPVSTVQGGSNAAAAPIVPSRPQSLATHSQFQSQRIVPPPPGWQASSSTQQFVPPPPSASQTPPSSTNPTAPQAAKVTSNDPSAAALPRRHVPVGPNHQGYQMRPNNIATFVPISPTQSTTTREASFYTYRPFPSSSGNDQLSPPRRYPQFSLDPPVVPQPNISRPPPRPPLSPAKGSLSKDIIRSLKRDSLFAPPSSTASSASSDIGDKRKRRTSDEGKQSARSHDKRPHIEASDTGVAGPSNTVKEMDASSTQTVLDANGDASDWVMPPPSPGPILSVPPDSNIAPEPEPEPARLDAVMDLTDASSSPEFPSTSHGGLLTDSHTQASGFSLAIQGTVEEGLSGEQAVFHTRTPTPPLAATIRSVDEDEDEGIEIVEPHATFEDAKGEGSTEAEWVEVVEETPAISDADTASQASFGRFVLRPGMLGSREEVPMAQASGSRSQHLPERLPSPPPRRRRSRLAYVLVPPPPAYLRPIVQRDVEGSRDSMEGKESEVAAAVVRESTNCLRPRYCQWNGCRTVMNSGEALKHHVQVHVREELARSHRVAITHV
ncbi:hypothetical protein BV25DRAFT_1836177 [Artomyces pyxidatus]|uniref:Uncharacterized protein n=1 Tax=Artomyces pyxidatus TaxID=48021 RepID=A0ACB8TBZ8_9AGAM|nr:hypothetical protein BV25DRAFT_1836177 [Artomyces pyxidatus]